ncbi:hypothetical protein [Brevibacillus sp. HD3.3A]|uniref:hypothetical protein n=1 Tax=Brevibacillus sp. HD3.3A TaxID=2738979 RepID=UPI00156AB1F4|nr:hypothetical protein [Brevibacillus sp. HD3.3A]UED72117.1 hypothetical protein HP435_28850 [Brevibacillus sp. HD3.3A]
MNATIGTLTTEIYLRLKEANLADAEIAKKFGMKSLTAWKKERGLNGVQNKPGRDSYFAITPRAPWVSVEEAPEESSAVEDLRKALQEKHKHINHLEGLLNRANVATRAAEAKAEQYLELLKTNGIPVP